MQVDSPSVLNVVFEDERLLVVDKPADLVCHPTKGDAFSSLISRLRIYFGEDSKPQMINRLDRETSGLVMVAKNPQVARELRILWEKRQVRKVYQAIVHGTPAPDRGIVSATLGPDSDSPVAIKDKVISINESTCRTHYRVLKTFARIGKVFSLLEVTPETGKKHQIRIHLAHIGNPIVGDKLYGHDENCYLDFVVGKLSPSQKEKLILPNHALHAQKLAFTAFGKDWEFQSNPEIWFSQFIGDQ
jgi:23S rRNA pseudouridine1911/1915/1917 synthase